MHTALWSTALFFSPLQGSNNNPRTNSDLGNTPLLYLLKPQVIFIFTTSPVHLFSARTHSRHQAPPFLLPCNLPAATVEGDLTFYLLYTPPLLLLCHTVPPVAAAARTGALPSSSRSHTPQSSSRSRCTSSCPSPWSISSRTADQHSAVPAAPPAPPTLQPAHPERAHNRLLLRVARAQEQPPLSPDPARPGRLAGEGLRRHRRNANLL